MGAFNGCSSGYTRVQIILSGIPLGNYVETDVVSIQFSWLQTDGTLYPITLDDIDQDDSCFLPRSEITSELVRCNRILNFSSSTIDLNTSSYEVCLKTMLSEQYRIYTFTVNPSLLGTCLSIKETQTNYLFSAQCFPRNNTMTMKFILDTTKLAVPNSNRIDNNVYVDTLVSSFQIRQPLALSFNSNSDLSYTTLDTYSGYYHDLNTIQAANYGLSFDDSTYLFSGIISMTKDNGSFDIINSRLDQESPDNRKTVSISLKTFQCTGNNYGTFPIIITRVHGTSEYQEIFELLLGDISIGDTKDENDSSSWGYILKNTGSNYPNKISEYAVCLYEGSYSLKMYTLFENKRIKCPWMTNSYVTFTLLSSNFYGLDYKGYIVGDFGYTPLFNTNVNSEYNIATFSLGILYCDNSQKIVILDKYATTNGGTEVIQLYNKQNGSNSKELLQIFYGFANMKGNLFDPHYHLYMCLNSGDYIVYLSSFPTIIEPNETDDIIASNCTSWSRDLSVELITYKNDDISVTQNHISMIKLTILSKREYIDTYKDNEIIKAYEGDKYTVLSLEDNNEGRNDIHSSLDCYYSFNIIIPETISFELYDNYDFVYEDGFIIHYTNEESTLNIRCPFDYEQTTCSGIQNYQLQCYNDYDLTNLIDCSMYGLTLGIIGIKTFIEGIYASQVHETIVVYMTITAIIDISDEHYLPNTKRYEIHIVNENCPKMIFLQQGIGEYFQANGISISQSSCQFEGKSLVYDQDFYISNPYFGYFMLIMYISSFNKNFTCTIGGVEYLLHVQPICSKTLYPLFSLNDIYTTDSIEICTNDQVEQTICIYNPEILKATLVSKISICHRNRFINTEENPKQTIPAGYTYLYVIYTIVLREDSNTIQNIQFVYREIGFRNIIEFVFREISPIPLKDVYIVRMKDGKTNVNDDIASIEIVLVTQYESYKDIIETIESDEFTININNKLYSTEEPFWSIYKLQYFDDTADSKPSQCDAIITDEPITFTYYSNELSNTLEEYTIYNTHYKESQLYEYSYFYPDSKDYPENTLFTGCFTRRCKPKYYNTLFTPQNKHSFVQYIHHNGYSIHMNIVITNLLSSNADYNTQYLISRALHKVFRTTTSSSISFEFFDINVFMVKNSSSTSDTNNVNTSFYTEIKLRNINQYNSFINFFNNEITNVSEPSNSFTINNGSINEDISTEILDFMQNHLSSNFHKEQKTIQIFFIKEFNKEI
ncbi:hypothetical protein WA158_006453 [Blastocystis sp. Blastoise]